MTTTGKGVLFIPCENMAAWMTINNTFAWGSLQDEYRQGILVQLGDRKVHAEARFMNRFRSIIFQCESGKRTVLHRKDFQAGAADRVIWINVFPRAEGNPVAQPTSQGIIDLLTGEGSRPLRSFFNPVAHLICWNAREWLRVNAQRRTQHRHLDYSFELGGSLVAQFIHETASGTQAKELDDVIEIIVSSTDDGSVPDDGGDEGDGEDPPQQRKP